MNRCLFALGLALLAAPPAPASDGTPAGVILYTQTPHGVWLLLADHRPPSDRGWASFGGSHEPGEGLAETAAREAEEETHGYFTRADILTAIRNQPPVFDGAFAMFFVRVDHIPTRTIVQAPIPEDDPVYAERGPFAWIPYAEVQRLLARPDTGAPLRIDARYLPGKAHTDYLWPVWVQNLRTIIAAGGLPWDKPPALPPPDAPPRHRRHRLHSRGRIPVANSPNRPSSGAPLAGNRTTPVLPTGS